MLTVYQGETVKYGFNIVVRTENLLILGHL